MWASGRGSPRTAPSGLTKRPTPHRPAPIRCAENIISQVFPPLCMPSKGNTRHVLRVAHTGVTRELTSESHA
eukprot:5891526-Heterocapsa_arctica.AAC.1